MAPALAPEPTHFVCLDAVKWAIRSLGSRKIHPTFIMYLYLRREDRAGRLADASASSSDLLSLIRMPGNPSKPYYFPLVERGGRSGDLIARFWRSPNIPGSWSPASIRRMGRGSWLGSPDGYEMPFDHAERAHQDLLYGVPVSALAMAAYFMRNDAFFLGRRVDSDQLIKAFREKFDFPTNEPSQSRSREFDLLFHSAEPSEELFDWFEEIDDSLLWGWRDESEISSTSASTDSSEIRGQ